MPRKTTLQAHYARLNSWHGTLLYLLRNREFQTELGVLRREQLRLYGGRSTKSGSPPYPKTDPKFQKSCDSFAKKWGVSAAEALWYLREDDPLRPNPRLDELAAAVRARPVSVTRDKIFLTITIDTRFSLQDLLPLVEQTLRHSWQSAPRKRHHGNSDAFRLAVWDRKQEGKTTTEIAAELGRPKTAVKAAWVRACLLITGRLQRKEGKKIPSLRDILTHIKRHPPCSRAERIQDYCPFVRPYIEQDHVSRREGLGRRRSLSGDETPRSGRKVAPRRQV